MCRFFVPFKVELETTGSGGAAAYQSTVRAFDRGFRCQRITLAINRGKAAKSSWHCPT